MFQVQVANLALCAGMRCQSAAVMGVDSNRADDHGTILLGFIFLINVHLCIGLFDIFFESETQ